MVTKGFLVALLAIVVVEASYFPVAPVVEKVVPVVQVVKKPPQPFSFGYQVKAKDGEQFRHESSDGHVVKGSYGFHDIYGIKREVNYIADDNGFRAQINTNEPGTANQNPAGVHINSYAPYGNGAAVVVPVAEKVLVPAQPVVVPIAEKVLVPKEPVVVENRYGYYGYH